MTWGSHNTEAEGHAQADLAVDRGVTFWDTAEMYPVAPVRAETIGRTEEIIGTWLASRGGRDRIVIATKITGKGQSAVRGGGPITPAAMPPVGGFGSSSRNGASPAPAATGARSASKNPTSTGMSASSTTMADALPVFR